MVAILAVVRAGAAYLPVDLDHPAGRIAAMVADAGPILVLTDSKSAGTLPGSTPKLLLDEPIAPVSAQLVRPLPAHCAYVIFTSGSTGRPKESWSRTRPSSTACCGCRPSTGSPVPTGPAEDPGRFRRVGVGVLLAADLRGDPGDREARRTPRPRLSRRADPA
ncbi:AMP-binding protein [Streptomyces sp. M10(2022)]